MDQSNSVIDGKQLLMNTTAGSLFPPTTIVSVSRTDSISTAFEKMIDNKILSVPVFDRSKGWFTCFLDMVDIVAFCVKMYEEKGKEGTAATALTEIPSFKTATCGEIADLSRRNPYMPVESTAPLLEAVNLMAKWDVQRLPIVDADGELVTIVSQSEVVKFVYKYLVHFSPSLLRKTASSIIGGTPHVVTIGVKERAIDAFISMHEKGVGAIAVVDEEGKIVGNISASDLGVVGYDGNFLPRLFYPISEYLHLIASKSSKPPSPSPYPSPFSSADPSPSQSPSPSPSPSPSQSPAQSPSFPSVSYPGIPPAVVQWDTSFGTLIGMLVNRHIHNVYMVDASRRPIAMIGYNTILHAVQTSTV